jgi:sugar phosphate isomerase/epimerase
VTIDRSQIALNALQWINLKPETPGQAPQWLYDDPAWRSEQPRVHQEVREAGFDAVMLEVLDTQTLQAYKRMIDQVGLRVAPGYVVTSPPQLDEHPLSRGSAAWVRWFDPVRRRAEESNFMGLSTVFLAAGMDPESIRITQATAVGAGFDHDRLDRYVESLADAAAVLNAEGIRPGLHNHIGTWIETEYEIDYALQQIDSSLVGVGLDIGHLAWAGIDYKQKLSQYADRLVDLHIKDIDVSIAEKSRAVPTPYYDVADQRFFLEPGLGDLDLTGLLEILSDFKGWLIIEVDRPSMDPFESAKASWKWVEDSIPTRVLPGRDHG